MNPHHVHLLGGGIGSISETTPNDIINLDRAREELYRTCLVGRQYPCIQTITSFISRRVTLSVLSLSESVDLRSIVRQIIDSIITVGYVALYVNRRTGRMGVVPFTTFIAVTPREYCALTGLFIIIKFFYRVDSFWIFFVGSFPPTEGKKRPLVITPSHYPYFFDYSEGESYFHPKFGYPLIFIGEWPPDHGCPTTPCSQAYDSFVVWQSIMEATRIAAVRSGQPPTGFVMTQQIGGIGRVISSLDDVTSSVGVADVLRVAEEMTGNRYNTHQAMAERTTEKMYTHQAMRDVSADEIAAKIWSGGEGNMSWTPPSQPASFDFSKLDDLTCTVGAQYGVPARVFFLTRTSGNTASVEEASGVHWMVTSHLTFVKRVLQLMLESVQITTEKVVDTFDPESLQVCVPLDLLTGIEKQLSSRGRRQMYANALGVDPAMISDRSVEEIKGDLSLELARVQNTFKDEPPAKRAKTTSKT
jgi:hypothetical protein